MWIDISCSFGWSTAHINVNFLVFIRQRNSSPHLLSYFLNKTPGLLKPLIWKIQQPTTVTCCCFSVRSAQKSRGHINLYHLLRLLTLVGKMLLSLYVSDTFGLNAQIKLLGIEFLNLQMANLCSKCFQHFPRQMNGGSNHKSVWTALPLNSHPGDSRAEEERNIST